MRYKTDLSDTQWRFIKHLFERRTRTGEHLVRHDKRELINAVLYIVKTGCQWRMLPNEFPPYSAVYAFFSRAQESGLWEELCMQLVKEFRTRSGRKADPTFALIDSQSKKTTGNADDRGYDGGKKVKGRKLHIVTDIDGNLLLVIVHAANNADTISGAAMLDRLVAKYPSLQGVCGDAGYRGTFVHVATELGLTVEIVERLTSKWEKLPKRWRVERTFAWMIGSRRLSKDYEVLTSSAEAMVLISHSFMLLRRLVA